MVRFSEIQQFPNFLDLFPGNLRTICPRFENFGNFGRMKSQPNTFLIWRKKVITKKVISELKRPDGKTIVNEQDIMTAIQTFNRKIIRRGEGKS